MTIGEKILYLRNLKGMSQEDLAEKLNVSRQSIFKWEANQASPQIENVLQICEIFNLSADDLMKDNIDIMQKKRKKYFGTDGFRGEANLDLNSDQAYKIGRFLGWYFSQPISGKTNLNTRPRIVIGKDTRRSSYMLEYSIVAGITASGADAYMLHVTTTPSVSYVTRMDEFDCGIMITASHNAYHDNGIKIVNRYGEKLDDKTIMLIESYLNNDINLLGVGNVDLPFATRENVGSIIDYASGRNRYIAYLISLASFSYKNLRIGLDCANGASWMIANAVFNALGAKTELLGVEPNGLNINKDCGSTHIENLCALVKEKHLDMAFAFDGDADRCLAVDENSNVVDGDKILYILANRLKRKGCLNKNTVVSTIMSNSGLVSSFNKIGVKNVQTQVGDRYVYENMQNNDYSLGGEQSGHIIIKKYATTGDGILTAIMLTEEVCETKSSLSKLCDKVEIYPQMLINVKVKNKDETVNDEHVKQAIQKVEEKINGNGRVLLRPSGTEPVIRIMVECEDEGNSKAYAEEIRDVIVNRGYCVE